MLPLHTTLLNNEELTTAASRLSVIWNPLFGSQTLLMKISETIEADRVAIVTAATRKTSSDFTDPLKASDALRDAAFSTLRDFIGSWVKNPVATAEQKAATARLLEIFGRHGNTLHRLGYNEQTGKMDQLITDLQSPASAADLAALSLTAIHTTMMQAQTAFETLMGDKAATEGGQTLPTIAEHRPRLERCINLMLSNLSTWLELDPNPALTEAAGRIDEVIVQIVTPALARRTRAQNDTEPAAPAPQA